MFHLESGGRSFVFIRRDRWHVVPAFLIRTRLWVLTLGTLTQKFLSSVPPVRDPSVLSWATKNAIVITVIIFALLIKSFVVKLSGRTENGQVLRWSQVLPIHLANYNWRNETSFSCRMIWSIKRNQKDIIGDTCAVLNHFYNSLCESNENLIFFWILY